MKAYEIEHGEGSVLMIQVPDNVSIEACQPLRRISPRPSLNVLVPVDIIEISLEENESWLIDAIVKIKED